MRATLQTALGVRHCWWHCRWRYGCLGVVLTVYLGPICTPPPPWVLSAHGLLWVRFCCCRCCRRCWRYKWNGIAVVIADCTVSVLLLLAFPSPLSGSSWPATISQKPHHMSFMLWTLGIHIRCDGNFKIRTKEAPSCDGISHVIYVQHNGSTPATY